MATGRPGPRYIGDGICTGFDGCHMVQETQDGCRTANRIAPEGESRRAWTATVSTSGTSTSNGGGRGRIGRTGPWAYRQPRRAGLAASFPPRRATRHARPRHRRLREPRDLLGFGLPSIEVPWSVPGAILAGGPVFTLPSATGMAGRNGRGQEAVP